MGLHPRANGPPPAMPSLLDGEEVWGIVRSQADLLIGTDRRLFRVRPDGTDEWPYSEVRGVYPVGATGVYVLAVDGGSLTISLPEGPDREASIQALTVLALLVGLNEHHPHRG